MDPATVPGFRGMVSEARFGRYLDHCDQDETAALRLYVWNIEITAAFWGPISILEIVMRNALNDQMKRDRASAWWDLVYLMDKEQRSIDRTKDKLREVVGDGVELDPDAVVGSTDLGFWVGLTGAGIPRDRVFDYETKFWQPRLIHAFPNLGGVGRKELHDELQRIRAFRNRLAHHEAVFNAPHAELRDRILRVVHFLNADMPVFVSATHRIDAAIARREAAMTTGEWHI